MSNVFKEFRAQKGMTQKEAGDLFGVSGSYWGELENDQLPEHKVKTYRIALKHINNASIYTPINSPKQEMLTDLKKMGLSPQQVEDLTGINASTWKNLAVGINKFSKKWTVLVNAAIIELVILTVQKNQAEEKALAPVEPEVIFEPISFNRDHLRTDIDANNNTWFCLTDICKQVDYSNPAKAAELISQRALTKRYTIDSYGRSQEAIFVTESGMYQFLTRCQLPKAAAFSDWVTEIVLPAIRKTGSYSARPESTMPAWAELLLQQMGGGMVQMSQDIQQIKASIPKAEEIKTEAVKAVFEEMQSLDAKRRELKKMVSQIVIISKKLPKIDPLAKYANYGTVYNDLYAFAEPPVSRLDKYTTESQIQASINRAELILIRLGGASQLGFDFEVM